MNETVKTDKSNIIELPCEVKISSQTSIEYTTSFSDSSRRYCTVNYYNDKMTIRLTPRKRRLGIQASTL